MFRIGLLITVIALPIVADETRTFRCPQTLTAKMEWPRTISAEGPDGPIALKLLEAPKSIALESAGAPALWVPPGGITCIYAAEFNVDARYGDAGTIKSCPAVEVSLGWPASVGSNPKYELNKMAPDPSGPIKFDPKTSRNRASDTCTYRSNSGGYPGFYAYPRSAGDACTVNDRDDTVTCTIRK